MLRGEYLLPRHAYIASQEPAIFHCHHYNTYLQAVIEDAKSYLNVYPILIQSAQEIVYSQFHLYFQENKALSIKDRKTAVEDYFKFSGFGLIDLSEIHEKGGIALATSDHYATGWKSKFGKRSASEPGVSFFTLGYILGATEAIYNLENGALQGKQTHCIAKGDGDSRFSLQLASKTQTLQSSPKEGEFQTGSFNPSHDTTINSVAIRDAVLGMPLIGSDDDGLIDAFGVLLTRMYANYYCLISYRFLKLFEKEMAEDGIRLASELLTEAGHVCAFNTFGGIMQSAEWNALIKPMIQTKEDWVYGIVSVVNALGWGIWEVEKLVPNERLEIKITNGYESTSFLKQHTNSSIPVSFLAKGGVAGIMDLVYHSELTKEPISLTEETYQKLFKGQSKFKTTQTACRAMGDTFDYFVVDIGEHV